MSLNDSVLNTSGRSIFSESVLAESTLNKNVNFSKLDISEILKKESTFSNTKRLSQDTLSTPKLSITLEEQEKKLLKKKNFVNGNKNASIVDITHTPNGSLQTTTDAITESTIKKVGTSTDSVVTEVLDEDESVIPVDDDDVQEVSTFEKSEETQNQSIQKEMFSHLQPNKNTEETEQRQEQEMAESFIEQESSQLLDENNLFQYPFIEVGRRLWPSTLEQQFYTRGCLWSPDGTCLLVPVHLDGMHIVELPTDLYTSQEISVDRTLNDLSSAVHVSEGGTVYDCCWNPFMNSYEPVTCFWLATRQHEPIHMWDAFSGELRCSYRGYDEVDEVESAISLIFSNDAQKVIGGYKKTIKIFDTNIPGRNCSTIPVKKAISCFALTTDNDNCVTAGNWAGYINHFDLRAPKLGPLFTLGGHNGGITWLKYSPTQDHNWYLFSGARKDDKIIQWDMRNYKEPLQIFKRNVDTNQRIYYDLTPMHTWLASGDTEGLLRVWNLFDNDQHFKISLHQDCCNGVSFHPSLPIISTTSGQYHLIDVTVSEEDNLEKIIDYENCLLFLWYGPSKES